MTRRFPRTGLIGALALLGASTTAPAFAGSSVVVELYTSQGCSSCPPADRLLSELRERPGVIALSLNVDYWDYLGWKDDLARPEHSTRQRAYAKAMRSRRVYTPQMMIDGRMDVIGSRKGQVEAAINAYLQDPDEVDVAVDSAGSQLRISAREPGQPFRQRAVIWLVGYDTAETKQIERGENAGRAITYTNVVRDWREGGRWDGGAPLSLAVERPAGNGGCVVIVQEGEVGRILGATELRY